MMRKSVILGVLLAVLATAAPLVFAVTAPSGIDPRLRLDWEAAMSRHGKPVIQGYVYNDYGRPAAYMRVLVKTYDAQGQLIAQSIGYVHATVPAFGREYFEVPLPAAGARHEVTVTTFEWLRGGGGN
ncbi:MAG TPA: FxLYD domain-containing protein [Methylomirabilota bacterium]|nr:FxLYD domain-containing protein [Methylomirabilota bacterium]